MSASDSKQGPLPKLFLGGLPPTLTEKDLDSLIRVFGEVKVDLIKKKNSELNDGYAFIYPANRETADRLLGSELRIGHRVLQFQLSQGRKVCEEADPYRLFMRNLPFTVSDEELTEFFRAYCRVRSAYSIKSDNKHSKGYGFIHLYDQSSADKLLSISNFTVKNFKVTVENYNPQSKVRETEPVYKNQTGTSRHSMAVKSLGQAQYLGHEFIGLTKNSWSAPQIRKHISATPIGSKAHALEVCSRLCEEAFNYRFNGTKLGLPIMQTVQMANYFNETDEPTVDSVSDLTTRDRCVRIGGFKPISNYASASTKSGFSKY